MEKSKIINFTEYLEAHKYNNRTAQHISAMVAQFHPKIEKIFDDEFAKMTVHKELYESLKNDDEIRNNIDLTVITSLCYLLSQYLISLSQRENEFSVDEDNLEKFVINIMKGMLKTFEKE